MMGMALVASATSLTARLFRMFMPGSSPNAAEGHNLLAAEPVVGSAAGSTDQHFGSSRSFASM